MSEQTATPDVVDDPLVVPFREALMWIAYRNLAGANIGPHRLSAPRFDEDDLTDWGEGRYDFALDLLLDHAGRGDIQIYAATADVPLGLQDTNRPAGFGQALLAPAFILIASYTDAEGADGPSLYWLDDTEDTGCSYSDLAVNYAALLAHFWGARGQPQSTMLGSRQPAVDRPRGSSRENFQNVLQADRPGAPMPPPLRPLTRRGARQKYKWAEFCGEVVNHCLSVGPVRTQAEVIRHMADWCQQEWGSDVGDDDIRRYVAPIFKRFVEKWRNPAAVPARHNSDGPGRENSEARAAE